MDASPGKHLSCVESHRRSGAALQVHDSQPPQKGTWEATTSFRNLSRQVTRRGRLLFSIFTALQIGYSSGCHALSNPPAPVQRCAYQPNTQPVLPDSNKEMLPATREKRDSDTARLDFPSPPADEPPALPAPEAVHPIDLSAALRLAGVENPTIGVAQALVAESEGRLQAANALLLPSLTIGSNVRKHEGVLQSSAGIIREVDSQSLYYGLGSRAPGGDIVAIPGIRIFSQLADAYYEPLAARQRVAERRYEAVATQNDILLNVAQAYLELAGAELRLQLLRTSEKELSEVVRLTISFARSGQGRAADANRALARAELLHSLTEDAEGRVAVAAARLSQLLNIDPASRLTTGGGPLQLIELVDPNAPVENLVQQGLDGRPEIRAERAAIAEARTHVNQERYRPLFPLLSVGFSAGSFGGGSDLVPYSFSHFSGRTDFDVFAVWTLQNAGLGNYALTQQRAAALNQEVGRFQEAINLVRQQVAAALGDVKARRAQVEVSRLQLQASEDGYQREVIRIRGGEGLPIEVLDSFRLLVDARLALLDAVVGYDEAQFRLFVALGCSPLCQPAQLDRVQPSALNPAS